MLSKRCTRFLRDSFPWLLPVVLFAMTGCPGKPPSTTITPEDSVRIVNGVMQYRAEADSFFRCDPNSPFMRDSSIVYHGIKWFPVDVRYASTSKLHRYANPETVTVLGTKGEERRQLRYGYFTVRVPGSNGLPVVLKMDVYKFTPYDKKRYEMYRDALSVWFTDETTGKETYDVGRYIDVGNEQPSADFDYTIDFNRAYNPYCAYSNLFSCAVPRKQDHLDVALRVGEMKYHD
jgi:uncharacterized protein (DUF1684 family)